MIDKKIFPNLNSNTICLAPWIELFFKPENNYFSPCCKHSGFQWIKGFEWENQPHLNNLKKDLNEGKKPKECDYCWKIENNNNNILSKRKSYLSQKNIDHIKKTIENENILKPKILSFQITRECNQACIMCSEKYSSFWSKINVFKDRNIFSIKNKTETDINIIKKIIKENNYFDKIYILGGEPFITDNDIFQNFLTLIEEKNVKNIIFSTNLNINSSVAKKNIDYLCNNVKKNIKITISLHGTSEIFEIISYPYKWDKFLKNLDYFIMLIKNKKNIKINFSNAINCFNVFYLEEYIDFLKTIDVKEENKDSYFLEFNIVQWPSYLSFFILNENEKEKIKKIIENIEKKYNDEWILKYTYKMKNLFKNNFYENQNLREEFKIFFSKWIEYTKTRPIENNKKIDLLNF